MKLYLCRHGEAEAKAPSDVARQLTSEGRLQVYQLWQKFQSRQIVPAHMVVSPYIRAQQTADQVARVFPGLSRTESPLLTPDSDPVAVMEWLSEQADIDRLLLVSHMPLVALLTGILTDGVRRHSRLGFATGAVAAIELDIVAAGFGELLWLKGPYDYIE